jgi:uncharacterized membrane protein YeaQ/YmgE (transglycosylase-associated protein family)
MNVLSGQGILVILLVGLIAGFLAGKIMRGTGFGIVGDILIGIIGALIGSVLFNALHIGPIGGFWLNAIITSTVGAVVLLFIIGMFRR